MWVAREDADLRIKPLTYIFYDNLCMVFYETHKRPWDADRPDKVLRRMHHPQYALISSLECILRFVFVDSCRDI